MPEYTSYDGVKLHYVVSGSGPFTVFYLHGMGGDVSIWDGLWAKAELSLVRVIALDFRGHGRSGREPCTFTNEQLARDVLQIADLLGVRRFTVVGYSFGGKVGLMLAALAPTRLWGLVLVGSVGPGKVPLDLKAVQPILENADDVVFVRNYFRPFFTVWPRPEIDRWVQNFAHTPAWAHSAVCEIALWTDITEQTIGISAPTLVIAGEHDPVYGPAYQRETVLAAIPHAQMVTVDCGHGLVLECPTEIAAHCNEFFAGLH